MTRVEIFNKLAQHPWLGRVYDRLTMREREIAVTFIHEHDHLAKGEFEYAVNRMFLDRERPRRYKEILELLTCANSGITDQPQQTESDHRR